MDDCHCDKCNGVRIVDQDWSDPAVLYANKKRNIEVRGSLQFDKHYWGLGLHLFGGGRFGYSTLSADVFVGPLHGWLCAERFGR